MQDTQPACIKQAVDLGRRIRQAEDNIRSIESQILVLENRKEEVRQSLVLLLIEETKLKQIA